MLRPIAEARSCVPFEIAIRGCERNLAQKVVEWIRKSRFRPRMIYRSDNAIHDTTLMARRSRGTVPERYCLWWISLLRKHLPPGSFRHCHLCCPHRETKDHPPCRAVPCRVVALRFNGILSDAEWNLVSVPADTRGNLRVPASTPPRTPLGASVVYALSCP